MAEALARHYATALYLNAVHNPVLLERVGRELEFFVNEVVKKYPGLTAYFDSRLVGHDRENRTLALIAAELNLSDETHGLLRSAIKRDRFYYLPEILKAFKEMMESGRASEAAQVVSARPLDEEEQKLIKSRLGRALGKYVELQVKVDPKIIAGIRVEAEYKVFDGSLRHQLHLLKQKLLSQQAV